MRKRIIPVVVLAIFMGLMLLASEVKGQDEYGIAQFYRNDAWPRSGLRAHFVLDMGVQGDSLGGEGSFETWSGPSGGCTDCPTGWTCLCASGDVDQEDTILYNFDYSIAVEPGAAFAPTVHQVVDFEANKCYQVSWCHYGEAGTEDFAVVATNAALTDVYDWATDSWGGGPTTTFPNIPASWTCQRFYLRNGVVAKPNYLIALTVTSADGTNVFVDQFRVQELNVCDVTGSRGNVLTNPVTSDPLWGYSEKLLPRVGTGPAGKSGMKTDGVDDHLLCPDADCEMDPVNWAGGGKFSVGCRVMPDTVADTPYVISKYLAAGNQRSWYIQRNAAALAFVVSDDGMNIDFNTVVMFTVDAFHNFVSTFDPSGGSGACENNIYYNSYQVDTDATMTECVPFDSTADLQIGAAQGTLFWSGSMLECVLWERKLSAVEANKYISPHFPATNHGDGFWVDTCSQAASHATCSTQVCRQGTPNECQAEGTGVMALFGQCSELVADNSWESPAGNDSNPTWPDWTYYETAGDGTANVTAYRADAMHGDISARMVTTGTTSYTRMDSDCITVNPATTYYGYLRAKKLWGVSRLNLNAAEYSSADCTSGYITSYSLFPYTDVEGVWTDYGNTFTTGGTAASVELTIYSYRSAADVLIDTISVKEAAYRTPWVENPTGAGTTTYNSRPYILDNPLARYVESEGGDAYASGWCVSGWYYPMWEDDGVLHEILHVPATAGTNNRIDIHKAADDELECVVYDSAGALRSRGLTATGVNWTAGFGKFVECCSDNIGTVSARHYDEDTGTWYSWSTVDNTGTGIQDGQATDMHVGHLANTNYFDGYTSELHVGEYSAIFPQAGFGDGTMPMNSSPY